MSACDGCGATVDPRAEACVYCKKVTQYGVHMRDYRAHQEVAAHHHRWAFWHHARMQGVGQAQRTGSRALICALLALVPCFCGLPALVAIGLALQARKEAKRYGEPMPGTALAALVFGGLVIAVLGTAITFAEIAERKRDKRIATLQQQVAGQLDGPKIKPDAACKLGEIKLLEGGYAGGKKTDVVDCAPARLEEQGDYLAFENVRVTIGKSTEMLTFCMKRGQRWSVEMIVRAPSTCAAPAPSVSSSGPANADQAPPRHRSAVPAGTGTAAPDAPGHAASSTPSASGGRGRRR